MSSLENWDDLKFFLAVAHNGNLTKAARCLAVNHSTVFRRIENLESSLSVNLFHKLPSGYIMTAEGEELFQTVQNIEDNLSAISKKLSGKNTTLNGPLRVITTDSIGSILLPKYIKTFHEQYSQIEIELLIGTNYLEDYTLQGDNDVFVYAGINPPEHWVGRRLGLMTFSVYGSTNYLQQYGTPTSINELSQHSYICGSLNLINWPTVKWLKENIQLFDPIRTLYSNSFISMFNLLKEGAGLCLFPDAFCEKENSLVKLFDFGESVNREVWVVSHPSIKSKAKIRAFIDFLADGMIENKVFK